MVKKLKYLFILFTLLLITDVNASTINGLQADSPTYAVVSSNYTNAPVRLWTTNIFGVDIVDYGLVVNDYVYVTACTDMLTLGYSYAPFYNSTTGRTASASDIRYSANLTSKTCTFSNGTQGKVVYIKFRLISDLLNVPVSGNNTFLYNDYITLNIGTNQPFSFSIQNISALDSDLDIYSNNFDTSLLEQQNQQIINNQNSNTNSIINNQDSNTQDIINNQNSNTDKEISTQNVCRDLNYGKDVGYLDTSCSFNSQAGTSSNNRTTDFIQVNSQSILQYIKAPNNAVNYRLCFYDNNKNYISYVFTNNLTEGQNITIPTNAKYIRYTANITTGMKYSLCSNGNQALNDSLNDLNDTLNSEDDPNTNQDINDMNDMVASDTPISDLITMPLTLVNAYINGINSTCSPINLGNLYGTDLTLPCINLESRLGSNLWSIIDTFFCIFMCYNIGMLFITAFDGITSLRDDFEGLYQPRHADIGYQPKHGGGN